MLPGVSGLDVHDDQTADSHRLGNDLAGHGPHVVQVGVPQLELGLSLEPADTHEQAKDDAGAVLLAGGLLSGLDDLARYDAAVGLGDERLLELARDALLDEVAQAEGDLGDLVGRDLRDDVVCTVLWEDCDGLDRVFLGKAWGLGWAYGCLMTEDPRRRHRPGPGGARGTSGDET